MEVSPQISLQFQGVGFPNIFFLSKQIFEPAKHGQTIINANIVPKVFYPDYEKNAFTIIMDVKLNCETVFEISLIALGNFKIVEDIDDASKKNFVNINAPAILFPYVRAFVSTFTSNLGYVLPHILLPPQFFLGNLEEVSQIDVTESNPTSELINKP